MSKNQRKGQRNLRSTKSKIPELGYYFIITDTKKTELNYMNGLRDSMSENLKRKLVIKVNKSETNELVDEAMIFAASQPQYGEPWIVFDKDEVTNFDEIIAKANDVGINVGWSNPCIEIWFNAYFGTMPTYQTSTACCDGFEDTYRKKVKQKYKKSDENIYNKLCKYGDENAAIQIAEKKFKEHIKNCNCMPSDMCPATTLHKLVKEIKSKIEQKDI